MEHSLDASKPPSGYYLSSFNSSLVTRVLRLSCVWPCPKCNRVMVQGEHELGTQSIIFLLFARDICAPFELRGDTSIALSRMQMLRVNMRVMVGGWDLISECNSHMNIYIVEWRCLTRMELQYLCVDICIVCTSMYSFHSRFGALHTVNLMLSIWNNGGLGGENVGSWFERLNPNFALTRCFTAFRAFEPLQ